MIIELEVSEVKRRLSVFHVELETFQSVRGDSYAQKMYGINNSIPNIQDVAFLCTSQRQRRNFFL